MRRRLLFTFAVFACMAGGVAAASTLTGTIKPAPAAQPGDLEPEPGTDSAEGIARPNGGPPWTVLVWKSTTNKTCAVVGQLVGGQVGRLYGNDPKFHPYPKEEGPLVSTPPRCRARRHWIRGSRASRSPRAARSPSCGAR